jgi:hypothetical protein
MRSTGPIAVGYSRRTSDQPFPSGPVSAASSSWRCASTPSFCSPGSTPSSWLESWKTSSMVIFSWSPVFFEVTVHSVAPSTTVHGGVIQLRGLYDPPSACTSTLPSAFHMSRRVAMGKWAESRPV